MKSVANLLSAETAAAVLALPVHERVALALRLGDRDVRICAAAKGISNEEARRLLRREGQAGRRPSACASLDVP